MWEQVNDILARSSARITAVAVDLLPGLLALIIIWGVTFLVAAVVRVIVRRSLVRLQFDHGIPRWGFAWLSDWSPGESPTLLVSRLTFWTLVFLGLLLGVSALGGDLTSRLVVSLVSYVPNVLVAIFIIAAGTLVAQFLARGALISAVNMQMHAAPLISLGVKWLILVFTAAMALEHLGIGGQIVRLAFGILYGGIVLALALAVGLGSKDLVSRSLERQVGRGEERADERVHHL